MKLHPVKAGCQSCQDEKTFFTDERGEEGEEKLITISDAVEQPWEKTRELYLQDTRQKMLLIWGIGFVAVVVALYSLNKGSVNVTPREIIQALFGVDAGLSNIVLWNIRLPRILAGLIAGAGLALAGCVMQTGLRNPLASPSTLGLSSAAAFGANIAIVFFGAGAARNTAGAVTIYNPYVVTLFAFIFSVVAMFLILTLARLKGFSPEAIILAGVAFSSLFSAGSALIQYFAEDYQIAAMIFWTFGDLGRVAWPEIGILSFFTLLAFIYFLLHRWDLNALDSGDDVAKSLGVNTDSLRFKTMLLASLLTAINVSFLGIIGFVGLIAPQMMRRVIGLNHRFLIPASAVTGAAVLLLSDTIARTVISPVVLPVGAITSFFGAPLFLFLLIKGYAKR